MCFLQLLNQKDYEAITVQGNHWPCWCGALSLLQPLRGKELLLDELYLKTLSPPLWAMLNTSPPRLPEPRNHKHFKKIKTMYDQPGCSLKTLFYPAAAKRTGTWRLSMVASELIQSHPNISSYPQTSGRQPFHWNPQLVVEKRKAQVPL